MTIQPPRPSLIDSAAHSDPLHAALEETETWKERARSAERRAQFAELRLRAMEARVDALASYVAAKPRPSRLPRLRILPYLVVSELKAAVAKIFRKIGRKLRR